MLTESGQTYERAVIERWFQTCEPRGQCRDPLTGTVLTTRKVRGLVPCLVGWDGQVSHGIKEGCVALMR